MPGVFYPMDDLNDIFKIYKELLLARLYLTLEQSGIDKATVIWNKEQNRVLSRPFVAS